MHSASAGKSSTQLAIGQVAASLTTVYTTPASTSTELTSLVLYNTGTTQETVVFAINGGADRTFDSIILNAGERAVVDLAGITLAAADVVKLDTTNATTVNYILSGVAWAA